MQDLTKYFNKAKLNLTIAYKPIINSLQSDNASKIFQMTIDTKDDNKTEKFRIFPGEGNDVRVLDYDTKKSQVLLFVKEPKRKFSETHYDRQLKKNVTITSETPDFIRRYLMGMDERHLFISELPNKGSAINKIREAHNSLKPYEVKDRKKRKKAKIDRQGEWFFVEATPGEMQLINDNIKFVEMKQAIGTGNKPHTAENMLKIGEIIFIKGKVRHDDHKTKEFFTWHRVFRNTEIVNTNRNRVGWID